MQKVQVVIQLKASPIKFQAGISDALLKIGKQPVVGNFVALLDQPELGSHTIVNILPKKGG